MTARTPDNLAAILEASGWSPAHMVPYGSVA